MTRNLGTRHLLFLQNSDPRSIKSLRKGKIEDTDRRGSEEKLSHKSCASQMSESEWFKIK